MPDYIYLLENRLSTDQQHALRHLREAAREASMILFLTGDAVRDLTAGNAVRELEVAVHGDALKLKKIVERLGGQVWGEDDAARNLYLCFPGTVRVDLVSTHRVEYPKPGRAVYHPGSILEDLRRRDFTVNAMAISLNEGSFGLLMDPLNGAADIEGRALRLVSNYGFLEEPSLLIRATRLKTRLGWELESRTQMRYDVAKGEGVMEFLSPQARSRELEQIGHEGDALKVLRALEEEGWMKVLDPAWTVAKADEEKLEALHKLAADLLAQGVHADMSAAQMQLLTSKLSAKELGELKKLMLRPGFVEEWNSLDTLSAGFAKVILAKENAAPSTSYRIFTSYDPEAILWLGFTSKDKNVQERFNLFLKVWPEARQRIPHALMQEMRITPELATYNEIVQSLFLEFIDGRLTTPEEQRSFLEPYSPPAPPPKETVKRTRAKRGAEAKVKETSYEDEDGEEAGEGLDEDLDDIGGDEDEEEEIGVPVPKTATVEEDLEDGEAEEEEELEQPEPAPVKRPAPTPASRAQKPVKVPHREAPAPAAGTAAPAASPKTAKAAPAPAKSVQKPAPSAPRHAAAHAKVEAHPAKALPHRVPPEKGDKVAKPTAVAVKSAAKAPAKPAAKTPAKQPAKHAAKGSVKPRIQGSVKPPVQGSVKPPVQGSVKPPVQGSVKPPVQGVAKPAVKGGVRPAAKAAAKAAPVKGKGPAKPVKAAAKPAPKKPAPKPVKKR